MVIDGAGLFDIRSGFLDASSSKCAGDLEVCCQLPKYRKSGKKKPSESTETTIVKSTTKSTEASSTTTMTSSTTTAQLTTTTTTATRPVVPILGGTEKGKRYVKTMTIEFFIRYYFTCIIYGRFSVAN